MTDEDETPIETPPAPPAAEAPAPAKCPDHPDAEQGPNGCTAEGCTYSGPESE